jgi:dihydroflavonol-4-reductase
MTTTMPRIDYLVTGASGFTGGVVTDLLLKRGKSVRALVRDESKAEVLRKRGVDVVVGDLNNEDALIAAVQHVGCILHIAALFRQAGLPSSEFYRVNVEGTRLLIDKAASAGVRKMVHCSTTGVHGHIENPPGDENTPYNPGDHYQRSKVEGEKLFLKAVKEGKIRGSVIRPAMIYGPGDTRTLKIFKPIANRTFFYVGKGDALVHFIDVRDLAESFLLASESEDVNGEVFIIAGETSLPLCELASTIAELMGVPKPWLHLPVKPMQLLGSCCEAICTPLKIPPPIFRRRVDFFTKDRCFDTTKAQRILGFKPKQNLVDELSDIIERYKQSGDISVQLTRQPGVGLR